MVKRDGNARNARKSMPFNPTGKLMARFVGLESINVTVGLSSRGTSNCLFDC